MVGKYFFHAGFAIEAYPQHAIEKLPNAKFFRIGPDATYRKKGSAERFVH
jgi:hypothetical protein